MPGTHVSLTWGETLAAPDGPGVSWSVRDVDWGMRGVRRGLRNIVSALRLVGHHRRADRLVICTAGTPVVVAGLAKRVLARRLDLVAVDFLRPPSIKPWILRRALQGVDRMVVIRRADVMVLARFGYPAERCRFVPFPAPKLAPRDADPDGFVYAGGAAQRDWPTLFDALARAGVPAVVSCPEPVDRVPPNVTQLGPVRPDEGRGWLARSRFLVMAIHDNDLPSGPLLLLDAFASGRPVVATDTNGTRDYIIDGENGILVPAGNPDALAGEVRSLYDDPERLTAMNARARESAARLTAERFWQEVLEVPHRFSSQEL